MPVAFTSRISLAEELPSLDGKRREVYDAIARAPVLICIAEIAQRTGLKECSVCGRVNELRKMGCIEDGPLKLAPDTGKHVKTYRALQYSPVPPDPKQGVLSL